MHNGGGVGIGKAINGCFGMVLDGGPRVDTIFYGDAVGCHGGRLETNSDFKLLAEAMGCEGYRVEKSEDLIPMLDDAFMQDVSAIIDCPIDTVKTCVWPTC